MIPAHKQTNPDKKPGQVSFKVDQTLGDYIARKTQHDAFNVVNVEKKLTFDEWYSQSGWAARHLQVSLDDADSAKYIMRASWEAAQENAPSQAPGAQQSLD